MMVERQCRHAFWDAVNQGLQGAVREVQRSKIQLCRQILVGPCQDQQHAQLDAAELLAARSRRSGCLRGCVWLRPAASLLARAHQLKGDTQQHQLLACEEVGFQLGGDVEEEQGCTHWRVALLKEGVVAFVPQVEALIQDVPPNALSKLDDHACDLLEDDGVADDAAAPRPLPSLGKHLPRDQELQELPRGHAEVDIQACLLDQPEGPKEMRVVRREVRLVERGEQHHPGAGEAVQEVLDHLLAQLRHVGNQLKAVGFLALRAPGLLRLRVPAPHEAPEVVPAALEAALHEGAVELNEVDQRALGVEHLQRAEHQREGMALAAEQRDLRRDVGGRRGGQRRRGGRRGVGR
mmetsp:Transcript_115939/g.291677  ORF Transcript_115939/g.291677 Transcript_115939/m.291677 type:complete len:350 (-) Transcript_115939:60-1109(-)